MRAQITKETFDGNYGKYENRPRDNTSFKDSTLDPNYRSYEQPFKDEFIENEKSVNGEEPYRFKQFCRKYR